MVDSIQVFDPGWQMPTDTSTGLSLADGIIYFFDAGTTNAKTVYSDAALSSSLGTFVNCNSAGYPVTSGNAKTLIYVDDQSYKVRITSATFGGTVAEFDNVRGALDTSGFLTSAAAYDESVVTTSSNRSVTLADKGKLIDMNCTAGDLTATIDDAVTLGDGWFAFIRHNGTANQIKIIGDGTDTFALPGASPVAFALIGLGQCVKITCNGANFRVTEMAPPFIGGTPGVIVCADQTSTPPGSPEAGSRYIVGASPSGAWSSFAENDIVEATGQGTWFKRTPAADSGLLSYIQSMDVFKGFIGSIWRGPAKVGMQAFTASGTYTPMAGASWAIAIGTGGGGGGGGTLAGTDARAAAGGGGGGTCFKVINLAGITSIAVTIGAGGAGGVGDNNGANGGDTTLGAHFTAGGGPGGTKAANGTNAFTVAGGTATGGTLNLVGGQSTPGFTDDSLNKAAGGSGGGTFWGNGGAGVPSSGNATAATVFGTGGGGAADGSTTARNGGAGKDGVVFVLEIG